MAYGNKIKVLRRKKFITQKEAAEKIGVTLSAWTKYETEKRIPRDDIKVKIAILLDASVQTIFYDSEEVKP